jgi:AraC-like DNA-binding protein
MRKKIRQRFEALGMFDKEPRVSTPAQEPVVAVDVVKIAQDHVLTFAEIAEKLKCSVRHVRRQFANTTGLVKIGNEKRVPYHVYLQFISQNLT